MRNRWRKTVSLIVVLMMISSMVPLEFNRAQAFDQASYKVTDITIGKTYDTNRSIQKIYITIIGEYLKDAEVGVITYLGGYVPLNNRTVNGEGILQFELTEEQLGKEILIEGKRIPINEGDMPTLTGVNRTVKMGTDDLTLRGTKLTQVKLQENINAQYGKGTHYVLFDKERFIDDTGITIPKPTGELGLQDIVFTRSSSTTATFNDKNADVSVNININYTYLDQFRFVQELPISPDLEMFPNRGEKGDPVFFRAEQLDEYDVFFLKAIDGTEPFTETNRAKNPTYKADAEGTKDILTVEVPDLPLGEYHVVLTNKISPGKDPMQEITGEKVIAEQFTIIDATNKAVILDIQPNNGPDTGSPAVISGQFLGSVNISLFKQDEPGKADIDPVHSTDEKLVVDYGSGQYNGMPINLAKRNIKVIIGNITTFNKKDGEYDVAFSKDLDKLNVQTPQVTDADINPLKDVIVETETTLTKADGSTIVIKERAVKTGAYTFISSKIKPEVSSIIPDKIQVAASGAVYKIPEDRMAAIHGKNLMIHKYVRADGTEAVRYPIIELGPELRLDKNQDNSIQLKVFDADGNELDGSAGSELGTKILFTIPQDKAVQNLGKTFLRVINPVRNSDKEGLDMTLPYFIEFVNPAAGKNPIIAEVNPYVVATDGGETITISGSNFQDGVKVFIDGEAITAIKRQEDGKKITFTAPKGNEGETQLQVMNPEGGMATWPFIYVKTYTNPKITDFSPKSGNTGTLVVIKGENFLKPDPSATVDNVYYRLIGTRVLLEGQDINDYNVNAETKKVELQDYQTPADRPLLDIVQGTDGGKTIKPAGYYHSIILYDADAKNFYALDQDANGQIILFDGVNNKYQIELNSEQTGFTASKEGGNVYPLTVDSNSLMVGDGAEAVTLKIRTPYKVKNGEIVGNRVKVVDRTQIYFTVPILPADGWYDVTVVNPDTKKDSKLNEAGFYYYEHPQSKPVITGVLPNEGSTDGGYMIDITGQEFEDNGTAKSRVFINGVEVKPEDVAVGVSGDKITVKVPSYPGDLREDKGTSRLTVPIVVINPDGAGASKEDGFTYVLPSSHPQITKIVPQKGSAAGGEIVEITGNDFRFFEPYNDADRDGNKDVNESFNNLNGKDGNNNEVWDDFSKKSIEQLKDEYGDQYEQYVVPVLPKVYFGRRRAEIIEMSRGYLKVITPPGEAGNVNLYVVNNDSGISNNVTYTYEASNPAIESIVPPQGTKQGQDRVEIHGSNFFESTIQRYKDTDTIEKDIKTMLVRFGNLTNNDIPRDEENSGRIDNARTTVNLPGGLTVEYDGTDLNNKKVTVAVEENKNIYKQTYHHFDGAATYIDMKQLPSEDGEGYYSGYEWIRLEIKDRQLLVERGYAPLVEYIAAKQLLVHTPSYYTIGKVPVVVVNPDGGRATGQFEYKNPDSHVIISNITKEGQSPEEENIIGYGDVKVLRMTYKGGNTVSVIGSDFREDAQIQISNLATIKPDDITYMLPTKLTFKMPAVPEDAVGKLHRVVVMNEDGGTAASDECQPKAIYIMFIKGETEPAVTKITPAYGPSTGNTRVKIEGKNFREGLAVYFGEMKVPAEDVTVADYKTIYVYTPAYVPGQVEVKVENPDGALSDPMGTFTYLSNPNIIAVVDPVDPTETTRLDTISVEGGQEIKIKGSGFMEGAKVVFVPELKEANVATQGKVIYIGEKMYLLESGTEGTDVKIIDSETLTVKTPAGKLDTGGIMIINPDNGGSEIYNGIQYGLPELAAPGYVVAEIVYDRYIKVNWSPVTGATGYEVYAVVDGETEYVGTTTLTSYVYDDPEPDTRYKFIVKATGKFGASRPSAESNSVRTGSKVGPPDTDGGLSENTEMFRSGDTANVTVGEDDYDEKTITVDLTRGNLSGSKKVVVSMPAKAVVGSRAKDIEIIGSDFYIRFNPNAFETTRLEENKSRDDAGVRFEVAPYSGNTGTEAGGRLGSTLSTPYLLKADVFIGRDYTAIDYTRAPLTLTLDYDSRKADMRRLKNISLNRYDEAGGSWLPAAYGTGGYSTAVTASVNRVGRYVIIGTRR